MNSDGLISFFQRAIKPLKDRVLSMIGRAIITAVNDSGDLQSLQIKVMAGESMEKIARFQEFGFSSNPPSGTEGILLALGGNRENAVIIATEHRAFRFKSLQSGESILYTDDGTTIHLKKNGEIELKTSLKVTIDAPDTLFKGNAKVEGNLEVEGTSTLTEDVACLANVNVTGIVAAAGFTGPAGGTMVTTVPIETTQTVTGSDMVSATTTLETLKTTYNGHTHQENGSGGGTTNPPTQQA